MTTGIHITHNFVSAKADGTDNTLVKPSNWNEDHVMILDSGNLLGRQTAGNGPAEEIACSSYMAALLASANFAALQASLGLPSTGDGKLTLKTAADTGWVLLDDGTIGNATSNASNRANADTQNLFNLLYAAPFIDVNVPLLTSTGAATTRAAQGSAATAFANGCRMSLPRQLGRTFIVAGAGAGLSSRVLGNWGGEESHALVASEVPNITSNGSNSITVTGPAGHSMVLDPIASSRPSTGGGTLTIDGNSIGAATFVGTNTITVSSINTGGSSPTHNNMQPWAAWNVMVKL